MTLILEDGAYIKKLTKTGTTKFNATKGMFVLVEPSKAKIDGAHSLYDGVHDVSIIGEGTAVIDLDYMFGAISVVMAHNQNIVIDGITFKNMNTGHFIEMDASLNVTVNNCLFSGSEISPKVNKEAINIDTPDKITGGFSQTWTSYDKTPDKNINITNCTFEEIDVAIGTHKYSQNQDENGNYTINMTHTNIKVQDCKFLNMRKSSFTIINWADVVIENCLFDGGGYWFKLSNGEEVYVKAKAFIATAVNGFIFRNNTIKDLETIGGAYSATTGLESASNVYTPIKTYITYEEMEYFKTNTIINVDHEEIYFNAGTTEFHYDPKVREEKGGHPDRPAILNLKTGDIDYNS